MWQGFPHLLNDRCVIVLMSKWRGNGRPISFPSQVPICSIYSAHIRRLRTEMGADCCFRWPIKGLRRLWRVIQEINTHLLKNINVTSAVFCISFAVLWLCWGWKGFIQISHSLFPGGTLNLCVLTFKDKALVAAVMISIALHLHGHISPRIVHLLVSVADEVKWETDVGRERPALSWLLWRPAREGAALQWLEGCLSLSPRQAASQSRSD